MFRLDVWTLYLTGSVLVDFQSVLLATWLLRFYDRKWDTASVYDRKWDTFVLGVQKGMSILSTPL